MNDLPLVSVVSCSYNNARFVIQTLDSIRNQTYPNIELIIVEDCSTDNSLELINNWLNTYTGKYKLIRNEVNIGGNMPCNSGLKAATGKYFCILDSDDVMLPDKLSTQVKILEGTDATVAAVYSDAYVMDIQSELIEGLFIQRHRQFTEIPSGNIYNDLLQGNYIPILSMLMKRSILDDVGFFDETLVYGDYDLWLRIAQKYRILFSDFICATYRIRPGSLTHVTKNWAFSDITIFLKHIGAPLPIQRLRDIAVHSYAINDGTTMPLINLLADRLNDRYFKIAFLLWHFGVAHAKGHMVLAQKDAQLHIAHTSEINTGDLSGVTTLCERLFATLSIEDIKEIARDAYANNIVVAKPLIKLFLARTHDRYFKTVHMLWRYKVFVPNGLIILERINGYCSVNVNRHYIDLCIYKDIFEAVKTGNSNYLKAKAVT